MMLAIGTERTQMVERWQSLRAVIAEPAGQWDEAEASRDKRHNIVGRQWATSLPAVPATEGSTLAVLKRIELRKKGIAIPEKKGRTADDCATENKNLSHGYAQQCRGNRGKKKNGNDECDKILAGVGQMKKP